MTGNGRLAKRGWRPFGGAVVALALLSALATQAGAVCVGNCNGDDRVSIAEVQACVNLGAGLTAPACAAADQNLDGTVGTVDPNDEVGACIQAFLDAATCPMVYTPVPTPTHTNMAGPTATNTATPTTADTAPPTLTLTETPSATSTPTPTIAEHTCVLNTANCMPATNPACGSKIQIHIEALPVPLEFGLAGSLDIGAAGNVATCAVQSLSPVNIPSIGFVCISGSAGCTPGTRHCGPGAGPALGIAVNSDGDSGPCTSNADCQTIANDACGGAANVLTAQCTGQCSGSTPQACTSDAQCLPANGACNGKEPVVPAQSGICQVSCIDLAAHGPSDPGDAQCNLGSNLNVETGSPCDGTDILIAIGQTCIPFTTQRATGIINDANFSSGTIVPVPPNVNDVSGNPVACDTVDSSTLTGFVGVGAVNFFGSTLGDLSVGLKAQCQ